MVFILEEQKLISLPFRLDLLQTKCEDGRVDLFCKYMQIWMSNKVNLSGNFVRSLNL